MKHHVRVVLCISGAACVAVTASSIQAQVQPLPLWAYAYSTQPNPGDTFTPQAPPNRNLRPNEDPQPRPK